MTAFLVVDIQNDFMPGGSLPVPHGDEIIPLINQLMQKFHLVIATQDWHPADHLSFASNHPGKKTGDLIELRGVQQILWPDHCIQNTKGAQLVSDLNKEKIAAIFYKGTDKWVDSYSAFFDNARLRHTGLEHYLRSHNIHKLFIAGVATDYCVLYSVLDALELGFETTVIKDACRAINLSSSDEELAFQEMKKNGADLVSARDVLSAL